MVVSIVTCVCLVVVLVLSLIWLNEVRKAELKTNKHKQLTYDKWYDLGVLIADIESKKIEDKEIK